MIELIDLTIGNRKQHPLVSHQTIAIPEGELTALVGRNGCGKTTLLRTLAGLQRPFGGKVMIDGRNINELDVRERAEKIAVVTSERVHVDKLTCREFVSLGRSPYTGIMGRLNDEDKEIVEKALERTGMEEFGKRYVTELSDGEHRRIMIAQALAQSTPIILLDDPTSFLDIPGRYEICVMLSELAKEGKTIVYSTHELQPAIRYADKILYMRKNGLLIKEPPEMEGNEEFRMTMRLDLLE